MPRTCPRCALLNLRDAARCDCGFDFRLGRMVGSALASASTGVVYAGFWRRAAALVVDLLVTVPFVVLVFQVSQRSTTAGVLAGLVLGLFWLAYSVYFHSRWGQTVGKMVARIKVTRLDGTPITLGHALRRNAVDLVLWVIYACSSTWALATWPSAEWAALSREDQWRLLVERHSLIGAHQIAQQVWMWSELLVLLLNEKRRALHDFIAGTVVVNVTPGAAPQCESRP